jgi:ubiquinone/menaquinone biosynthesis C-methylase UbiE
VRTQSDVAFSVEFLRRSREIYRRYLETKPWIDQLYTSFLGIKPGQRIVDVGCGTGDFTLYLARLSGGRSKILGIDKSENSIETAVAETRKAGLSKTVSYKVGDVHDLPVEDGYSDLTCCRTLLMHLVNPVRAIREMARITRTGGSVAALEGIFGERRASFYDPSDEKFSRLAKRGLEAWFNGIHKLEGKEFRIGEQLPGIFKKAGLYKIRAEVQTDAWLYSDPRRRLGDVKADLRYQYTTFRESRGRDRKYLLAGGMSESEASSYLNRRESRAKMLLSDDDKIRDDVSVQTSGLFLVSGMIAR